MTTKALFAITGYREQREVVFRSGMIIHLFLIRGES